MKEFFPETVKSCAVFVVLRQQQLPEARVCLSGCLLQAPCFYDITRRAVGSLVMRRYIAAGPRRRTNAIN